MAVEVSVAVNVGVFEGVHCGVLVLVTEGVAVGVTVCVTEGVNVGVTVCVTVGVTVLVIVYVGDDIITICEYPFGVTPRASIMPFKYEP